MENTGVERFSDNLFTSAARENEERQKGKLYCYELRRRYAGIPDASGKCVVLSRRYDRCLDCDVLSCKDTGTGENFFCNQFQITLEECV